MIELKNVSKYFTIKNKKHYLLKNVSFSIPENKNIAILGRNGVGKSTLLRILGQIDFPNTGKILTNKTFSWPLALSGGFQGSLSGKDNAKFVLQIYGLTNKEITEKLKFIQEYSELEDFFHQPVSNYSSGMKSKLGFALSLCFQFDYYLIDETLSVGDRKFREKSKKSLNEILVNKNIIMVSHSMSTVKDMCDIGIVLENEKLSLYEDIDEAIKHYNEL